LVQDFFLNPSNLEMNAFARLLHSPPAADFLAVLVEHNKSEKAVNLVFCLERFVGFSSGLFIPSRQFFLPQL